MDRIDMRQGFLIPDFEDGHPAKKKGIFRMDKNKPGIH